MTPLEAACLNHGSSCPMDSTLPFCGFFWISAAVENAALESAAPFVVLLFAFFSWVIVATATPLLAAAIVAPLPLLLLRGQPLEVELMTPTSINSCCSYLCSCSCSDSRSSCCYCCYYCWNSQVVVVVAVAAGVGDHSTFPSSSSSSISTASRAWILLLFLCYCCNNNLQILLLGHNSFLLFLCY